MAAEPCDNLYLSPHLDDVVLSCGGTIHRCAARGARSTVVTIFAGSPGDDGLTAFARELKERWGGAGDPVGVRRQEDLEATRAVGADAVHLDLLDCVYRTGARSGAVLYATVEHIFGDVHPEEASLYRVVLDALEPVLVAHPAAAIYAPLGVGHHVDHLITLQAALALRRAGRRVLCYEDYPYAVQPEEVARALALQAPDADGWVRQVEELDAEDLRAKADAVAAYRSQISTFWPDDATMRRELAAYARTVGGGRYGEAYWRLPAA